jgi:radical SAM family uncharacterized protein/radical SAM-linked protein
MLFIMPITPRGFHRGSDCRELMTTISHTMSEKPYQDILSQVQQPSRYLGTEINTVHKDFSRTAIRLALAFPDLYEIGTSHFGLQILYHLLNADQDVLAERVFAPAIDMEARMRRLGQPMVSLESRQRLTDFDIIGFSLLYELNFTNILTILDLAGIPFMASERDLTFPLVIAGGPCACNPEPVADFFDAIVIGDGEAVVPELVRVFKAWKAAGKTDKNDLLRQWSRIEGVYIPTFFTPVFEAPGIQRVVPRFSDYTRVTRAIIADLNRAPFPDAPILPFGKPVHDRLRIEVARGCTRGCRYCQAGMIYRPVRERSVPQLLDLAKRCLASTGYEDLSLLSLSTGDYGGIVALMQGLMGRCQPAHIAVSLPSLRAGTLTPQLMALIQKVRKTGFTIAPEAGSQRLRDLINKNITAKDIVGTVQDAFSLGWQVIKLYFMIGLPTETDADLDAIVDLTEELRQIRGPSGRRGKINVSVTTFIPKPHTPFQWAGQLPLQASKDIMHRLQTTFRNRSGVQFKWQDPRVSLLEGLFARGDRRLSRLLVTAWKLGCRFDGWSDQFDFSLWQNACIAADIDLEAYTTQARGLDQALAWDHIDSRVTKPFLAQEWHRALAGTSTADCRKGSCQSCGVCDFEHIAPVVFDPEATTVSAAPVETVDRSLNSQRLRVTFSKLEDARFFGHLELANIFLRAMRRADLPLVYSGGFHPKPRLSFSDPLPIGMESQAETMVLTVFDPLAIETVAGRLNAHLPKGLRIVDCRIDATAPEKDPSARYRIWRPDGTFDPAIIETFKARPEWIISRTNRKGRSRQIDLKAVIDDLSLVSADTLEMVLLASGEQVIRPLDVMASLFGDGTESLNSFRVLKLAKTPFNVQGPNPEVYNSGKPV